MNICFTICTNSHLGKAKAMADSIIRYNPHYEVVIGLMDRLTSQVQQELLSPHTIIEVEDIQIPDFEAITKKYTLFEISCVGKPYFAMYLFEHYPELSELFYFDSDIYFYDTLQSVEQLLDEHDICISTHFTHDLVSECQPQMRNFLNAGLYNTGFLGFKRSAETNRFLEWWANRLQHEGFINFAEGMFVDQLWVNFVPLLFKKVWIDADVGHNVGYWNFHERVVTLQEGKYFINDTTPLVFFHFSGYEPTVPQHLSVHQDLYSFQSRPDVVPIFEEYRKALIESHHAQFQTLPNAFYKRRYFYQKTKGLQKKLVVVLRNLLRVLES